MAITRKEIKEIIPDIGDDALTALMGRIHAETDGIKDERDAARNDAKKAQEAQKKAEDERDAAKNDLTAYQNKQKEAETYNAKREAYRAILKDAGIADKHIDKVLRRSKEEIAALELDDAGKVKGAKAVADAAKEEWGEYITDTETHGQKVETPPSGTGKGGMTKEQIFQISDTNARQKAIAENHDLFGF